MFSNIYFELEYVVLRIVAAQSEALERNKCRPRIVAAASKHGMHPSVRMIFDDSHYASARTVHVVQVVPTADSRIERLHVLLTVSSNCHHLTHIPVVDALGLS